MADLRSMIDALDARRKAAAGVPMSPGDQPVTLPSGEQLTAIPKPEGMTPRDVEVGAAGMMVDPAIQAGESASKLYRGEGDWKENLGGALGHGAEFLAGVMPTPGAALGKAARVAEEVAPAVGRVARKAAEKLPLVFSQEGIPSAATKALQNPQEVKEFAKQGGKVWGKVRDEPGAVGPLDLTQGIEGTPGVSQYDLERYAPPRGVSDRLTRALSNPDVINGVRGSIKAGMDIGAHKWYNTEPIRLAFVKHLGEDEGTTAFKRYMDYISATSPQNKVPTNIRDASYYYHLDRTGQPIPDVQNPYPYGSKAQIQHKGHAANIMSGGEQYDPIKNPKPVSFTENLKGNLQPVTVDTHAFRNIGMRTRDPDFLATSTNEVLEPGKAPSAFQQKYGEIRVDPKDGSTKVIYRPRQLHDEGKLSMDELVDKPIMWDPQPNKNEYAAVERFYKQMAEEHGLAPAEAQAAAWAGAGNMTGLRSSARDTFTELFNRRVEYTARMRGEDPQETLRLFVTGQKPLLQLGTAAAGTTALGAAATRGRETNPAGAPANGGGT